MQPEGLKYSTSHEWLRVENDLATIGVTDHAQSELGDIVFVELPVKGASLHKDAVFGSIESVKTVSDLVSPVSGEVTMVNDELQNIPEAVNEDPYGRGWMVVVRLSDTNELDGLMSADQYEEFIREH